MNQAQLAIKNKMDSILLSARHGNSDEIRKLCRSMDDMDIEERRTTIRSYWGEPALQKVEPLLIQFDSAKDA